MLRKAARKEFEQAREERVRLSLGFGFAGDPGINTHAQHRHKKHTAPQDPLIVARLLVVGRDCLLQTQYKVRASYILLKRSTGESWSSRA